MPGFMLYWRCYYATDIFGIFAAEFRSLRRYFDFRFSL